MSFRENQGQILISFISINANSLKTYLESKSQDESDKVLVFK